MAKVLVDEPLISFLFQRTKRFLWRTGNRLASFQTSNAGHEITVSAIKSGFCQCIDSVTFCVKSEQKRMQADEQ